MDSSWISWTSSSQSWGHWERWRWGFGKRLIRNTGLLSQEKKNRRIQKRKLKRKKSGGGVAERKKTQQTLEGCIIQKWESCDLETLNLTRCIKAMEEREEAKPDKRAASRKKRERWDDELQMWQRRLCWKPAINRSMKQWHHPGQSTQSLGLYCVTHFHSAYLCTMNLKRTCYVSPLQLQSICEQVYKLWIRTIDCYAVANIKISLQSSHDSKSLALEQWIKALHVEKCCVKN